MLSLERASMLREFKSCDADTGSDQTVGNVHSEHREYREEAREPWGQLGSSAGLTLDEGMDCVHTQWLLCMSGEAPTGGLVCGNVQAESPIRKPLSPRDCKAFCYPHYAQLLQEWLVWSYPRDQYGLASRVYPLTV